jgi:hypothetical protein
MLHFLLTHAGNLDSDLDLAAGLGGVELFHVAALNGTDEVTADQDNGAVILFAPHPSPDTLLDHPGSSLSRYFAAGSAGFGVAIHQSPAERLRVKN